MSDRAAPDIQQMQKRVVTTLAAAQILGGIGVASGVAVGALLAADLAGDAFSGLASSASVVGAAILAIPITRVMSESGRRPGLVLAYIIGILGALLIVFGAAIDQFAVAFPGMFLMGGGMAATLQNRFAASDLAQPKHRGRDLSIVVWATTIGSVIGPNLAETMGKVADKLGLPHLSGPYLMTIVAFAIALLIIHMFLRPDPLTVAAELDGIDTRKTKAKPLPVKQALGLILGIPAAAAGLASMALGQAVMTSVMSMTPVHLHHANASLTVVGAIISGHITGMYIASPLVGIAADRLGRRPVIIAGVLILLASFALAGQASGHEHVKLAIGLFLLGLGWSCTMIAGSTLLTESLPLETRPRTQGAADLAMGVCGATAGVLAGLVVGLGSYAMLNAIAAIIMVVLAIIVVREWLVHRMSEAGA
ncbi:MAG: MFS transporter [Thermomicrobiales bacterium]|nr:MFS transporter [Thermomicrobiales bacterium]